MVINICEGALSRFESFLKATKADYILTIQSFQSKKISDSEREKLLKWIQARGLLEVIVKNKRTYWYGIEKMEKEFLALTAEIQDIVKSLRES